MTSSMSGYGGYGGAAGSPLRGNTAGSFKEKIPSGYKKATLQQFTPEMMDLFNQMIQSAGPGSYLQRLAGGEEGMFEEIEKPAWRQFQESMGQLGSRYSQLAPGAMSAQRGSGFQQAGTQAASDFAMNLASQRMGLQRQAQLDLRDMAQMLFGQKPYESALVEKSKPFWQQLMLSAAPGFAQAGGNALFGGGGGYPIPGG